MGTSKSPQQLVEKLIGYANTIPDANKDALVVAAMTIKTRILAKATPATGGDLRLSGTKNKKVGVFYKLEGQTALVKATGPMHWLEAGVRRHTIVPKAAGGSRAARTSYVNNAFGTGNTSLSFGSSRRAFLSIPGYGGNSKSGKSGYAAYARNAGGLKAKHVWSEGIDESREPVRRVFETKQQAALLKAFS